MPSARDRSGLVAPGWLSLPKQSRAQRKRSVPAESAQGGLYIVQFSDFIWAAFPAVATRAVRRGIRHSDMRSIRAAMLVQISANLLIIRLPASQNCRNEILLCVWLGNVARHA